MNASICKFLGERLKNISYCHLVYTLEMRLRELKVSSLLLLVLRNFQKNMNTQTLLLLPGLVNSAQHQMGFPDDAEFLVMCGNRF